MVIITDSKSFELRSIWVKGQVGVLMVERGEGYQRWMKMKRGVLGWLWETLDL